MDARALDGLEKIAEQTSLRVDERGRHGKFRWAIPPNIERVSASHEKKKTPKPIVTKRPPVESAVTPPTVSTCIARPVTGYKGLVETCRQRAIEMAISRLELDRLAGLPSGYSAKLLGKDDGALKRKRMWPASLEAILGTLGLQIVLIEDHVATSKTLSRRVPVDHCNQRFDNKCNSKTVPQLAPPQKEPAAASRAHLRVVQGKRRGSKHAYG
jgi:hypothetical protein